MELNFSILNFASKLDLLVSCGYLKLEGLTSFLFIYL